jgi:sugar/nucleoside kinase (ribokinase family)
MSVIDQMSKRPKLIVLDTMNFWMNNTPVELNDVIRQIDVLTINDEEARQLTGEYSLVKAAAQIQAMGPRFVIIKKGEHGALLFNRNNVFFAPALPLEEIFDPTGAGDTFAGGLTGYLTESENISFHNLKNGVIQGANLASFCVERFGTARLNGLKKQEVEKRLVQFKELTQFDIKLQS